MNLFQSKKLLLAVVLIILIDQIIQSNLSAINIKRGNFILKQKKFISELYMDEQYFDCISETRRLLYYYPDIAYYNEYLYFIDANYFLGKQYRTVINNLKGSDNYNDLKLPYYILLSRSYHNLGLYKDSIRALKQIDYRDLEYTQRFELFIRRIEIYIHNSKYKDALKEIKKSKKNIIENNN
ncbi:MAG: hypothetical protein SVR08_12625, partial [Spirochaetota bacterium]|nr:hypothetical protein [Spirochaetota bacterium]